MQVFSTEFHNELGGYAEKELFEERKPNPIRAPYFLL